MRNYIGLANSFHDPALAIVNSYGEVVFAEATERYLQNKRAMGAPPDDPVRINDLIARYCEPNAEIVFAKTWEPPPIFMANNPFRNITEGNLNRMNNFNSGFVQRLGFNPKDLDNDNARYLAGMFQWLLEMSVNPQREVASSSLRFRIREKAQHYAETTIERHYNHHLTHAATACWSSPFEEAICAVIDGYGKSFETNAFYHYKDGHIKEIRPSHNMDTCGSLGLFYAFLCVLCGFDWVKGEEWKVMGLASYGKVDPKIFDIMFGMLVSVPLGFQPAADFMDRMGQLIKFQRKGPNPLEAANLACTGQEVFSQWSGMLLAQLATCELSRNLVLTGGCALNSSWNGRILNTLPFDQLYVPSAPADDGNAIGAALLAYREDNPADIHIPHLQCPFLGEDISKETLDRALIMGGVTNVLPLGMSLYTFVAGLLAYGMIVGWMQGRAEFGPRALGNRSILADPRDPAMKDRINGLVKFREEYRPFAPSILHEYGPEYFHDYQDSPYMERTLRFREEVKHRVPAVVHEDGTGRLQTVHPEWNTPYFNLITEFHRITGIPLILNTSFNIMGKPIIHTVEDALALFYTTGLEALVISNVVILKKSPIK